MEDYQYIVCTRCYTYNQAMYIEETLDGFCMQKTTYPFVCTIVDDASTDGEPEVIKDYLKTHFDLENKLLVRNEETENYYFIFAQHKTNTNCFFAVYFLKYNHHQIKKPKKLYLSEWVESSKYNAICEGDDYWIDPLKLQKQVGFMEAHPEHSLCFCAHRLLYPSGETKDIKRYEQSVVHCPMEDIILGGGGFMATNAMLYRHSLYSPYWVWAKKCPIGDLPLMLTLANNGFVGYLADVMSVYRVSAVGSWSSRMSSSSKLKRKHYHAINRMWHQFDKWSNNKYHKVIKKKIRKNRFNYYRDRLINAIHRIKKW